MAKTGYSTWWVPEKQADMKQLLVQHQRVFPGNQLSVIEGFVKVAVLEGDTPSLFAISYSDFLAYIESLPPKKSPNGPV